MVEKGEEVIGRKECLEMLDELKKYWMSVYNNRIEFLSEATNKYNCHVYAWHMTEGRSPVWINNPVWINTPEDDKYWND